MALARRALVMRDQDIVGPHLDGASYRKLAEHVPRAQATLAQVTVPLMGNRFTCRSKEAPVLLVQATQELVIVAGGEPSQARS